MPTVLLPTHTPELFRSAVVNAAERLRAGELVVVPTETVYGLASNALDGAAVRRIFEVKGRPAGNPVIVHVAGAAMAARCVAAWPDEANRLAAEFWPGPLTLVLPRNTSIPDEVTAKGGTVGIRWPSHPFMQALIRECGFPLAAPSANRSNAVSPTSAMHAMASLAGRVSLVVDGGASQVGIESTVVDLAVRPWKVLRPGMILEEEIRSLLGGPAAERDCGEGVAAGAGAEPLRSPGQIPLHYAPRAQLRVWPWALDDDLRARLKLEGIEPATLHIIAYKCIPHANLAARICVIPEDPEAYARALYAEWHRCDELGARTILVEAVPATPAWKGIADRIARASASRPIESAPAPGTG